MLFGERTCLNGVRVLYTPVEYMRSAEGGEHNQARFGRLRWPHRRVKGGGDEN